MICPKCKKEVDRQTVDVGVGVISGPYGCFNCGWSEDPHYDCSEEWSKGNEKREGDGFIDPLGGWFRDKKLKKEEII